MKNDLIFFMIFLLSLLLFFAHTGEANIPCSTVMMKAAPCVTFATGKATTPAVACCSGLQQLAQSVKSVDDKKAVCRCLKGSAKNLGVQDRFLTQIPTACKIKLGFPVSTTTSCDTIQ